MKIARLLLLPVFLFTCAGFAEDVGSAVPQGTCCKEACADLIPSYEKIAVALAADDLKGAIDGAEDLGLWAECLGEEDLDRRVADLERSRTIDEARIIFRDISKQVIRLAQWIPGHYVMTCPMAKADWIQTKPEVANPYYGAAMLHCGSIKETVGTVE
ncbi:MAG: hypothetical protein R3F07_03155 [Opitutaceae bacterium]